MQKYFVGLIALLSPFATVNAAGICQTGSIAMPASTPSSQFSTVVGNDDVIIDKKTNLMWQRCTYGFGYNASTSSCDDLQILSSATWMTALDEVKLENDTNSYGYSDWRLPSVKELASIIERQCVGLAINNVTFPNTSASMYWTNTHVLGSTSIRTVNFGGGVVGNSTSPDNVLKFRLVRDN